MTMYRCVCFLCHCNLWGVFVLRTTWTVLTCSHQFVLFAWETNDHALTCIFILHSLTCGIIISTSPVYFNVCLFSIWQQQFSQNWNYSPNEFDYSLTMIWEDLCWLTVILCIMDSLPAYWIWKVCWWALLLSHVLLSTTAVTTFYCMWWYIIMKTGKWSNWIVNFCNTDETMFAKLLSFAIYDYKLYAFMNSILIELPCGDRYLISSSHLDLIP